MISTSPTVLVIDDEPPIRRLLRTTLSVNDYRVIEAADAREGLIQFRREKPDVIILDLGLPNSDGIDFIREVRKSSHVPIVVLSSRQDEKSKVSALDLGADDYVTKPFGVEELIARIRAALRHRLAEQGARPVFRSGDLSADLVRRIVTVRGRDVKLTPKEYGLLEQLVIHAGKVLTHRHLLKEVWASTIEADVQYLRVYVRQLRQKIEPHPERPIYILTEPGVGYRLQLRDEL
ncbi:MAG: response regulator [Candidatus Binataceae bacterium]